MKKGESDSKYRDSRPKTRLGLGIGLVTHELYRLGLGLGLVFAPEAISDSKSRLENLESGNSDVEHQSGVFTFTKIR